MGHALVLRSSAKINLMLRVGARLPDGYHDVRTLLQSIALFDTLTFSARPGPFALLSRTPGVPTDSSNLVWRAAERLWRAAGRVGDPRDVHVNLEKQIPVAAGLGGGSSDAAAALVGLNTVWDMRKPLRELAALAAELGSDVPFFLQGGTAIGVGRGADIYPVDDIGRFGVIVIKPSFGVSAADAYRWLDDDRDAPAAPPVLRTSGPQHLDVGWSTGAVNVVNDLQASVGGRHPAIAEMIDACRREGALVSAMSGSGSSVFAVFSDAAAARAVRRLQRPDWLVLVTRTLSRREAARRLSL